MRATNCSPKKVWFIAGVFFFLSMLTVWRRGIADAALNVVGGIGGTKNGDVNGDGSRDISDAVALLNWLFTGGPEPVPNAGGEPCSGDDRRRTLEHMLIEKGDAVFALTSRELLAVEGTEPRLFLQGGIQMLAGNFAVVVTTEGLTRRIPVVYVNASMDLLDVALTLQDSGDPVEITYRYSDCIGPVLCDSTCHTAGLNFHAIDSPIGSPLKCQRVNEDKTCTDKLKAICKRQLYWDNKCQKPARGFVLSAGSITFGGSLVVDPILQRAVRNGIESALEPQVHELFRRGDSNGDGRVDLSDTIATLGILFFGGENRGCKDAQDANDGRAVYISTPSLTLGVLFFGNGVIPAPRVASRGLDPTMDDCNCEAYQRCS